MNIIKVSTPIIKEIKKMLQESKTDSADLRIACTNNYGGMSFNLFLDEVKFDDIVEEHEGLKFMVARELCEKYQGFTLITSIINEETYLQIKADTESADCGGSCCSGCSACG